jgi:oligoribonuclease
MSGGCGADRSRNVQVIITNGNLEVVDDGIEFVIRAEKAVLDKFDCTITVQHNESKKVTA